MVSTDDKEFAEVAKRYGASIPFLRSEATSNDYATTVEVLFEVVEMYRQQGKEFDVVCCLYSTAPFVTANRLKEAFALLNEHVDAAFTSERLKEACGKISDRVDGCFSVVEYSYPIQRSLKMNEQGLIEMRYPEHLYSRTQDLEKTYHDAGQFYFMKTLVMENEKTVWCKRTEPLVLSELEVQDLDTLTEMKYKLIHQSYFWQTTLHATLYQEGSLDMVVIKSLN